MPSPRRSRWSEREYPSLSAACGFPFCRSASASLNSRRWIPPHLCSEAAIAQEFARLEQENITIISQMRELRESLLGRSAPRSPAAGLP